MTQTTTDAAAGADSGPPEHTLAQHFNTMIAARVNQVSTTTREIDALCDALLRDAVESRASDIHMEPLNGAMRIRLRIDGDLLEAGMVPGAYGARLLNHFKAIGNMDPGHLFRPRESRLTYRLDDEELDLRLTVSPCLNSETMVIRLISAAMIDQRLAALGLSERDLHRIHDWLESTTGMLAVCGPTGSGKTTTVYSILREMSRFKRSIFTIEDPVEYQVEGINQIPVDEEHGLTFNEGIKSILRMDPDYMMLGEMRDGSSADAGLTAANRGTVVLTTMHSRDPFGVITTFRNWHIPDNEIAVGCNVLIAQRLVRCLCPECKHQAKPNEDQKRWLRAAGAKIPAKVWEPGACEHCRGLGYHGRTGIFEIWQLDEEDYDAVLNGVDEHTLRRQVHAKDHGTMLDDGLDKIGQGITSVDELRTVPDLLPLRALLEHDHKRANNQTRTRRKRATNGSKSSSASNGRSNGSGKKTKRSTKKKKSSRAR